jgi:amino acid adenylation domain-containing protein
MISTQSECGFNQTETGNPAQSKEPKPLAGACFPLSPGQQRLWFVEQMYPQTSRHNIPQAWHLRGRLDFRALAASVAELGRRHETLRTAVVSNGDHPVQVVYDQGVMSLGVKDLSGNEDPRAALASALAQEAATPFELAKAPLARFVLFRLAEEEHALFLNLHHIIGDQWSVGVISRELASLYAAQLTGADANLAELPLQFADYAVWQREQHENGSVQEHLSYWKQHLQGELPVVTLPADHSRPAFPSGRGTTVFVSWPKELALAAGTFSRSQGATLFMTLMAAFKALLFRYCHEDEIPVGTTFSGRNRVETEALVGFFARTHVLRSKTGDDPTFLELLRRVRDTALGAEEHQDISLDAVVKALTSVNRVPGGHPLFQVMLGLQTGLTESLRLPGLEIEPVELDNGTSKFDLTLLFNQTPADLRIRCEYSTDLFERGTIEQFLRHFEVLLKGALENPGLRLSQLPLLTDAEREQVLFKWNRTRMDYPIAKRLHELFEQQALEKPGNTAVVCGEETLTYGQLNDRASRVAQRLQERGVQTDMPVGICLRRSPSLIVGLLAILKSGAAYLPLDAAYPKTRLQFMVSDARTRLILTERSMVEALPDLEAELVCLDDLEEASAPETSQYMARETTSRNLAYVIYTSGSTGQPKGVALEHRGAVALMCWARKQYTAEELNGVFAATSICFDLSVFEIFAPLSWGGRIILGETALSLSSLPAGAGVTLLNTVPSAARELLALKAIPASIRVINLAGEPLSRELVDRIYVETAVEKIYDLYGPTETTTYSTGCLRRRGGPETIGGPLPNERVYVLDPSLQPLPAGVPGELFIGGDGVARGYINRPELTAGKFIADPFVPGARMYRTGDLARWRPDGTLQYMGRMDHQVKIRGFRIELGEVQAAIKQHPAVREALVLARQDAAGGQMLVAYFVPTPGGDPGSEALRQTVCQHVPEFMVPTHFVCLPEFPMTPNGKVDRAALPAAVSAPKNQDHLKPRTPQEEAVAAIWREVLGHDDFGVQDDFFRVGGHSLLATQVISRIGSRLGVDLPLRQIFELPTIAGLSDAILGASNRTPPGRTTITRQTRRSAAELLAALDSLSEAEVEELLKDPELNALAK